MPKILLLLILTVGLTPLVYGGDIVPFQMDYCGVRLKFTVEGRNVIQKEVDKIRDNPAVHQKMVERASTYFPYIQDAFKKVGVPADLTYIAIQESGLRGDAVSKSNAVGFWQFKESTAKMVGLTVNDKIDERKHIFRASIGAARYFATNYFRHGNWVYSVISYYEGGTGALNHIDLDLSNATEMTIDENLHFYAQKAIAHKIAYEDEIKQTFPPKIWLEPFSANGGTSLATILKASGMEEPVFRKHNLWLKGTNLPPDGDYSYFVPRADLQYVHVPDPFLHLYAQEVFPQKKNPPAPNPEPTEQKPVTASANNSSSSSNNTVYKPKPAPVTTVTKRTQKVVYRTESEGDTETATSNTSTSVPPTQQQKNNTVASEFEVRETIKERDTPITVSNDTAKKTDKPKKTETSIAESGYHPVYKWKVAPAAETKEKNVSPATQTNNNDSEQTTVAVNTGNGTVARYATKPVEKKATASYTPSTPKLAPKNVHPSQGYVRPNYATKPIETTATTEEKEDDRPLTEDEKILAETEAEAKGEKYIEKPRYENRPLTEDTYYNHEFVFITPTFGIVDVSSKFNIPVRSLCQYNGLKAGQLPQAGTVLYVYAPHLRNIYIPMTTNETIEEVAMRHMKNVDRLRELNGMKETEHFVKKGQKVYLRDPKPDYEPWVIFKMPDAEVVNLPASVTTPTPVEAKVTLATAPAESKVAEPEKTINYLTHTVEAFESLESIADKYETTPEALKDLNKRYSDEVKIGEVLRVKVVE